MSGRSFPRTSFASTSQYIAAVSRLYTELGICPLLTYGGGERGLGGARNLPAADSMVLQLLLPHVELRGEGLLWGVVPLLRVHYRAFFS